MNNLEHLYKLIEAIEGTVNLKQSDFGVLSTYYFEKMEEGLQDETDLYIALKKCEKFIEVALPFVKSKIDETKLSVAYKKHHVSLQTQGGRPTWDYSTCGDTIYTELNESFKYAQNELKEREKFLQSITKPTEIVCEETGEIIKLNSPQKRQGLNIVMRYEKD